MVRTPSGPRSENYASGLAGVIAGQVQTHDQGILGRVLAKKGVSYPERD
jgi:hypothetical protein